MKQRTNIEFITECNIIHNNKYDYSKTYYTKKDNKVIIICPIHGEFTQIAHSHLNGYGCKKCSKIGKKPKQSNTFITECNIINNNKYDYSKTNYINNKTNITIICPIHGEFNTNPKNHLNGSDCPNCSHELIGFKNRTNINKIIEVSKEIHQNKYDYSKLIYLKQGCPHCYNELRKNNSPSWQKDKWIAHAKKSIHFDNFKLYVIKCYNETETFYKVGRTYNTLIKRLSQIPYKYEVVKIITSDNGSYIFDLEYRFKRRYKKFKYLPLIDFGGKHECFKK